MSLELAESLLFHGYHPVILVGTRASGKTSLLTSLFRYLRTDPTSQAMCRLGEPLVSEETEAGRQMTGNAKRFFNHIVTDFQEGKAAARTSTMPYFIPVVFTPSNGQPETKFAILEIRGEFYAVNKDSDDLVQTREEIEDVYRNYPGPISVILVGPYVVGDAYQQDSQLEQWYAKEQKECDLALYGALQQYETLRESKGQDHLAFLLTKWDAHTQGIGDPDFSDPPEGLVEHLIKERYPTAWSTFDVMGQRYSEKLIAMQYSSGIMCGDTCLPIPPEFVDDMHIYPRKIWEWLYSNANDSIPLYPKVAKDNSLLQRIKNILL